jgi:hypothetical protein
MINELKTEGKTSIVSDDNKNAKKMFFIDFNVEAESKEDALKLFSKRAIKYLGEVRDMGVQN